MTEHVEALRREVERALAFEQPALEVSVEGEQVVVSGHYFLNGDLPSPDGPIATYSIRAVFDPGFPSVEPKVYEVAGVVPKGRHVNPDGSCCTGVWEEWLVTSTDHSVAAYLAGPFRDFFLSQVHFQLHGEWPFGERSHGRAGIVEGYASVLGIPPEGRRVSAYLRGLSRPAWARGRWPCPCGSGRRVKSCHREDLTRLRHLVSPDMATRMLHRMEAS